ncbi:MAG: transglutaminase-like domain-containing protein [Bacillota bacterium]
MKRIQKSIIMLSIVLTMCFNVVFAVEASNPELIESNGVTLQKVQSKVEGKISLVGETIRSKLKILIVKDEKQLWYDVNLQEGKFEEEIWLIDGKGKYQISILVHKEGRKYTFGPTVNIENTVEVNRFLVPTLHVESNNEEIVALAKEITKNDYNDRAKAKSIYNWVVKNIKYDYKKYLKQLNKNFNNDYGAINTLKTKKGVCYDYSTLVAALGRAVGIQVKVVKGNFKSTYRNELHAWNEIYISEEDKWINVDSTFGASLRTNYFDNSDFYKDHDKLEEY